MFREISVEELPGNPFIGATVGHVLVSAGNIKEGGRFPYNATTASWGALGWLWDRFVATAYLRPQSATKKLVDGADRFAFSFFSPKYTEALALGGKEPGPPPKCFCSPFSFLMGQILAKCGWDTVRLTPYSVDGTVSFKQASLILICKKLYQAPLSADGFTTSDLSEQFYDADDFHTLYLGEILKVYVKNTS
ncbi:MAG: hypothetical protein FWG17_02730 [Desulfovibrionaceae bacterium]|nr:hypothetical protein [Desulfovibrionaceae bacterium]